MMMMRSMTTCALLLFLAGGFPAAADTEDLTTDKGKISYLIGRQMGGSLTSQDLGGEIDADLLCQGIREALANKQSTIPEAEAREVLQAFSNRMRRQMLEKRQTQGAANRQEGDAFLARNKKEEGWKETESGLQYKVIRKGDGQSPEQDDVVEVHYRGTLLSGEEFDSSYERGEPAVFPLGRVIQGWQEALQMMAVGAKWDLVIPADLAYGTAGKGPKIGPDAVLRFQVELLDIKEDVPAQAQ